MTSRSLHFCGVPGCGKSFDRPAKLVAHQRVHSGERPFQCSRCSKSFTQRKYLAVHEIQHLDATSKPYICTNCKKGYAHKQQYDRHMKTHAPPQIWQCQHCPMKFVQQKSYQNHVSRHRSCHLCEKVCKNQKDLEFHIDTKHKERFYCCFCPEKFVSRNDLKTHCQNDHADFMKKKLEIPQEIAFIVGLNYKQRKYGCPHECGKRFIRQYDLSRHIRSCHTKPVC